MNGDLFITKEEALKNFLKQKRYFATHEVIKWGSDNFYNRADRTKRDFQEAGIIKKLDDKEKIFRGFRCKDNVYQFI